MFFNKQGERRWAKLSCILKLPRFIYVRKHRMLSLSMNSTLNWCWWFSFFLTDDNTRFIIYNQDYSCWWPGDTRSQGTLNHGIDYFPKNIPVCWILKFFTLIHRGRVTYVWVIIDSDNDLSPGRRQAIVCINAGILLIKPSETIFSEILIETHIFSLKKMYLNMSSKKCQPFLHWPQFLTCLRMYKSQQILNVNVSRLVL